MKASSLRLAGRPSSQAEEMSWVIMDHSRRHRQQWRVSVGPVVREPRKPLRPSGGTPGINRAPSPRPRRPVAGWTTPRRPPLAPHWCSPPPPPRPRAWRPVRRRWRRPGLRRARSPVAPAWRRALSGPRRS
eukprot:scaffold96667_cov63-Phaeocystis_antarctica.AAC.2